MKISFDGNKLYTTGYHDHTFKEWDISEGLKSEAPANNNNTQTPAHDFGVITDDCPLFTLILTNDSKYAFTNDDNAILKMWDLTERKLVKDYGKSDLCSSRGASMTKNGRHLLFGYGDGYTTQFELEKSNNDCSVKEETIVE